MKKFFHFAIFGICVSALSLGCSREAPAPAFHGGRFNDDAVRTLIRLDRIEGDNHRALHH